MDMLQIYFHVVGANTGTLLEQLLQQLHPNLTDLLSDFHIHVYTSFVFFIINWRPLKLASMYIMAFAEHFKHIFQPWKIHVGI